MANSTELPEDVEKSLGDLVQTATDLLHSTELPSWVREDHEQKAYSAGRIAKDAETWREVNRLRAIRIIDARKIVRAALSKLQEEVEDREKQLACLSLSNDTLRESYESVIHQRDTLKAELQTLRDGVLEEARKACEERGNNPPHNPHYDSFTEGCENVGWVACATALAGDIEALKESSPTPSTESETPAQEVARKLTDTLILGKSTESSHKNTKGE